MVAETEPFGAPVKRNSINPVPMFDPLLHAARGIVDAVGWLRREVDRAEHLCSNMEQVVSEMQQAHFADSATKQVDVAVARMREQVGKAHNFCERLENLTADLSASEMLAEEFKLPRVLIPPQAVGAEKKS